MTAAGSAIWHTDWHNSTIANNSASSGVGGGMNNAGTVTLINSTVAFNTAFDGGGFGTG